MDVLMPLPDRGFDPTESGVPFVHLADRGHTVTVATPEGTPAEADPRMVTGEDLGPWRWLLRADARGRDAYETMRASEQFGAPIAWEAIDPDDYDGLLLPGGHAPTMKPYLESELLQTVVAAFVRDERPVGAICHGVVLAARADDPETGESVLYGRRTTALTESMELSAWALTWAWLGDYYRTYETTVQEEVTGVLADAADFVEGPFALLRDSPDHLDRGFTVRDDHYLSARWPGDAHRFAHDFCELLEDRG